MRRCLLVFVIACSSKTTAPQVPPPQPTAAIDAAAKRAEFALREVTIRKDARALPANAELRSRDRFDFIVDLTGSAYVYVIRVSPAKGTSVLYPNATTNALPAGPSRIPADPRQIFALDDEIGEEHLYVVALGEPLSDGAAAVTAAIEELELSAPPPVAHSAPVDAGVPADAAVAVAPIDAGVKSSTGGKHPKVGKPAMSPLGDLERNVVIVSTDGEAACANIQPNPQGVAACRFTIKHVP